MQLLLEILENVSQIAMGAKTVIDWIRNQIILIFPLINIYHY